MAARSNRLLKKRSEQAEIEDVVGGAALFGRFARIPADRLRRLEEDLQK